MRKPERQTGETHHTPGMQFVRCTNEKTSRKFMRNRLKTLGLKIELSLAVSARCELLEKECGKI